MGTSYCWAAISSSVAMLVCPDMLMRLEASKGSGTTRTASGRLLELSASRRAADCRHRPQADSVQGDNWLLFICWNPGKNEGPMAKVHLVQWKGRRKWVKVCKHWGRRTLDVIGAVLLYVIVGGGSGQGVEQLKRWSKYRNSTSWKLGVHTVVINHFEEKARQSCWKRQKPITW